MLTGGRWAFFTGCLSGALCLFSLPVYAATTYFVAAGGNDTNVGTMDQPFGTMARGQQAAVPGDTVYFRAGVYKFTSSTDANGVALNKSGTSGNRINYWAYQNEVPIFDFSGMTAAARITGLRVTASWIHLKGIEVKLVPQNITTQNESWGIYNDGGSSNIYEMLNLHHNMGPGFFLGGGGNNLILNCDSHHNYDPKSKAGDGENADGFGCHPKAGDAGNVFRGIRAWWNTDDGYDSINAFEACVVENSWSWLNGYLPDTMNLPMRDPTLPPGNGNGFKLGGYGIMGANSPAVPPKHTIRFSVAFLNQFAGFFANYHTSGNYYYNNTGFMNVGADFNMLGLTANTSVLKNNLAYGPSPTANLNGTDNTFNSWNLPVQVSAADFQSISTMGMDGPRQSDGSLPVVPFMRLVAGSDLIDKGVDIKFPFNGTAPDLGAFESGGALGGAGGGSGAGGARGATGGAGGGTQGQAGAAAGGRGGSAGVSATGGRMGTGGTIETGGAPGSGGASSPATGGALGSGGALGGGGVVPSGGSVGTGGVAPGATGGASSTGGQAGAAASANSSGCGCAVRPGSSSRSLVAPFAIILALSLFRRRRHGECPRSPIGRTRRSSVRTTSPVTIFVFQKEVAKEVSAKTAPQIAHALRGSGVEHVDILGCDSSSIGALLATLVPGSAPSARGRADVLLEQLGYKGLREPDRLALEAALDTRAPVLGLIEDQLAAGRVGSRGHRASFTTKTLVDALRPSGNMM